MVGDRLVRLDITGWIPVGAWLRGQGGSFGLHRLEFTTHPFRLIISETNSISKPPPGSVNFLSRKGFGWVPSHVLKQRSGKAHEWASGMNNLPLAPAAEAAG